MDGIFGGCSFPWSWLVDFVLWKHLCPKGLLFFQKRKATLPKELVLEILSRLPTTSVIRFRLVSKEWCLLTSTQSFIEMHGNNQSTTSPPLESAFVVQYFDRKRTVPRFQLKTFFINEKAATKKFQMVREYIDLTQARQPKQYYLIDLLSSYKGFLLFTAKADSPHGDSALIFYNPVTKEQVTVTAPPSRYVYCGFFFHSPTKEYRILYQVFDYDHKDDDVTVRFELLGLQTRSLRKIYVNSAKYYPDLSTPAVISNGALHWMVSEAHHQKVFGGAVPSCSETILSFGMESEEFCLMPHPRLLSGADCVLAHRTGGHKMNLLEMDGGILCLCDGYLSSELHIFVMDNYEKWAWVHKHVFPFHAYPDYKLHEQQLKALQIHQGELLLHYHSTDEYTVEYLLYPLNQEEEEEEEEEEEPDDASYKFIKWLSFGSKNESQNESHNESKNLEEEFECFDDDNLVLKKKKTKKKKKMMMMMKKKNKEEEEKKKHFKVVIDQLLLEENDLLDDDQIIRRIVIKHPGSLHESIYYTEPSASASASASVGNIVVLTPSIASLQQQHKSTTIGTGNSGGGNYILSLHYENHNTALTEYDVQARKWRRVLDISSSSTGGVGFQF